MSGPLCSRRRVMELSGLTLGGLLLGSSFAGATHDMELSALIKEIIFEHYSEARTRESMVDQFVRDLLAQRLESLESRNFVKEEAGKKDRAALERYVLIQFMTSPGFAALQG